MLLLGNVRMSSPKSSIVNAHPDTSPPVLAVLPPAAHGTPGSILPPALAPPTPSHTCQDTAMVTVSSYGPTPVSSPLMVSVLPVPDVVMSDATPTRVESTKVLVPGDGTCLHFSSSDVPDSPALSFARDIAKLGRVWDDSCPEFSPSECTLIIQGHRIALKHWPVAYSYAHDGRWCGIRKSWDTYKVRTRNYQSFFPFSLLSWPVDC